MVDIRVTGIQSFDTEMRRTGTRCGFPPSALTQMLEGRTMGSTACRAAGPTGRGNPETHQPTRNATSSGKRGSARVCATAMTRAEFGRKVGRTEVNATPGVNLRLLSIPVPSNAALTGRLEAQPEGGPG